MTVSVVAGQTEVVLGRLFDNTKIVLATVGYTTVAADTGIAPITIQQVKQIRGVALLGQGSSASSGILTGSIDVSRLQGYSLTSYSGNPCSTSSIAGGNVLNLSYLGAPQLGSSAFLQLLVFGQ